MEDQVPAVSLRDATLGYGDRILWSGLNLDIEPGEFVTVLGPNGSGKTSLLRVLLGLRSLSSGPARIGGEPRGRGNKRIGYIPQQRAIDAPVRGRDLVGLGLDGHRWGTGVSRIKQRRQRVDRAIAEVGAEAFAKAPVSLLSGGE